MSGFRKFLLRGNLIDLAVAVVIGAAFSAVITALVKDLVTPLIAAIGGKPDFSKQNFKVHHSVFLYGDFLNAMIAFVLVAAVLYFFVIKPFSRLLEHFQPTPQEPAKVQDCPHCASAVPIKAAVCAFCTRDLPEVVIEEPDPPAETPGASDQRGSRHAR
jgi:large conductance mechanosensitive channel